MTPGRPQVLIVDDDLDIRETLADVLADRGFSSVTAANGVDALQVLRSLAAPPLLILLDLMMPIMDGYGLLEELEKDPSLSSIPVAVLSAGHGVERGRLPVRALLVPKPINLPKLMSVLHDLRSGTEVA